MRRAEQCVGRRRRARALWATDLALLASVPLCVLAAAHARAEASERIHLCDELLITVSAEQMVQHQVTVDESGLIEVPEIGSIAVLGASPQALADAIERRARDDGRKPLATVSIVRSGDLSCALVDLTPARRPERQPAPEAEAVGANAKPEIEFRPPGELEAEAGGAVNGAGRRDPAREDP
jgi:hypothetical protein